jgi:hypothetical protein
MLRKQSRTRKNVCRLKKQNDVSIARLCVRRQVAFVTVAVAFLANPQLEGHGPLFLTPQGSAHTAFRERPRHTEDPLSFQKHVCGLVFRVRVRIPYMLLLCMLRMPAECKQV